MNARTMKPETPSEKRRISPPAAPTRFSMADRPKPFTTGLAPRPLSIAYISHPETM